MSNIGFALGSNLGDRVSNLARAVEVLASFFEPGSMRCSPVYECAALLPEGAEEAWNLPFLNQVVMGRMEPSPDPLTLLASIKETERRLGRQPSGHWGPRHIDIDILFMDDRLLQSEQLTLPHPAMKERAFVMVPLAAIAPQWEHPVTLETAAEMASRFSPQAVSVYAD